MPSSRTLRKLCQVRDLMRDCLAEELTLADLSLEVDLSAWHFLRAFRAAFGETPHEFLTRLRLDEAKRLLAAGERSVTDICFGLGYESLGSFSVRFKELAGCSPSEYRRRVRCWTVVPQRWVPRLVPSCFIRHFAGLPL